MPYYAVLGNWTEEGIRAVKQAPQRGEAVRKAVEAAGGKVHSFLNTMGGFDIVAVFELPSDEVANQVLLRAGMQGFVRTTTLKGWTPPEFAQLVQRL
jgi:uncharacterized protein with GYD domain